MNLESEPKALLSNFITVSDTFIVSMREDAPEVVLMTAPGLTVWRINCLTEQPSSPIESFSVSEADLNHYYDAYLSQGFDFSVFTFFDSNNLELMKLILNC